MVEKTKTPDRGYPLKGAYLKARRRKDRNAVAALPLHAVSKRAWKRPTLALTGNLTWDIKGTSNQ
jgi:hypothetical protein